MSNLLKDTHPELFLTLHPTKNNGIDVNKITYGSNKNLWWTCSNNKCGHHIWEATPKNRIRSSPCRFCSGHNKCQCYSIMENLQWAQEFAFDLNLDIDPYIITSGSNNPVWWRCTKHKTCEKHIWQVSPNSRNGCPFCSHTQVCLCDSIMNIPKLRDTFDFNLNIDINPYEISEGSGKILWWKCNIHKTCNAHLWEASVTNRTTHGSDCPYCCNRVSCLCNTFMNDPLLSIEFDQELNPEIDPYKLSKGSNQEIIFKCSNHKTCNDHIWKTRISHRAGPVQSGCPFCNRSIQTCRCNSFMNNTLLSKEFIYEYNVDIDPWQVSTNSGQKLWWRCITCNNEWRATVDHRNNKSDPRGCPSCASSSIESKGAKNCRKYLVDNEITYTAEFKISEYLPNRRYDFMFIHNGYKWILEFDGDQHFKKCSWHDDDEDFIFNQEVDKIKNNVALLNGFNIIRIHDKDEKYIKDMLDFLLNLKLMRQILFFSDDLLYSHMRLPPNIDVLSKVCPKYQNEILNSLPQFDFKLVI